MLPEFVPFCDDAAFPDLVTFKRSMHSMKDFTFVCDGFFDGAVRLRVTSRNGALIVAATRGKHGFTRYTDNANLDDVVDRVLSQLAEQ